MPRATSLTQTSEITHLLKLASYVINNYPSIHPSVFNALILRWVASMLGHLMTHISVKKPINTF